MDYSETDDPQALEITALKAIYGDDFIECPPPKVWKGAARLPEFNIRVGHPDPEHQVKINLYLNVKFPKSYPHLAPATFTIQKPHNGLSSGDISKLGQAIGAESQRLKGSEMVMEIVEFTQHWLKSHIVPTIEAPGSLALQKNLRARDEERARTQRLAEQELLAEAQARAEQQALEEQIEADMLRQIEAHRRRGRARAGSEATEVQFHRDEDDQDLSNEGEQDRDGGGEVVLYGERERDRDMITEEFGLVEVDEKRRFSAVRLFHPRPDGLGTIYTADPILDDPSLPTPPLELFVVTFDAPYYTQSQGRKKLRQVEAEVRRLVGIRHPNLISVYAVKLYLPIPTQPEYGYAESYPPFSSSYPSSSSTYYTNSRGGEVYPRLMVLSEQFPALTLRDVLEDCESLREERASEYLVQILGALNVVHVADLVHRGISPRCIGLTAKDQQSQKQIKLGRVGYYTRLLDLHRSNPFGAVNVVGKESSEDGLSEGWLSRDVKNESSLLYTRQRDIHAVGIVLLQMLIGLNVTDRFDDVHSALQAYSSMISPSLARLASNMILPPKKSHINCLSLLGDLSEASFRTAHHTNGHTHHMNGGPRSPQISFSDPRTPNPHAYNAQGHYGGQQGMISASPEIDYFRLPLRKQSSRWKEDWEELELLGRGAFGSVVKAKNRIDGRIYAVKKIRLKTEKSDNKIFREVNALSRLSHRFIVRYYTTWVEFAEPVSTAASDDSSTEYSNSTSVPNEASERHLPRNGMSIDLDDLDEMSGSKSSDFPSIHFGGSGSSPGSSSEEDEGEGVFESLFEAQPRTAMPGFGFSVARTLYIQMEFVERQTLKEMVDEGISENEAWRLFLQILDALVHMSSLGILHRDIKLTNIFIDGKGDCKVGDFGLATSSLAAVDPSDVSPLVAVPDADMTLEVGTRLYIAPEVLSRKRGPRNHTKADMYSLGIVFFEMNYQFSTGAERIAVIEDLRKPDILFPAGWQQRRSRQKDIIKALLDHDPSKRPSALELSQSSMLPPKAEDEYFKGALEMMAKSDSPHHQVLLGSLFSQTPKPSRGFLYDAELNPPEHTALNDNVQERLTALFRLLGAIDMEPPLLMPVIDPSDMDNQPSFIDNRGDMVYLPSNLFIPFARHAARKNIRRIKRYHIANIYKSAVVPGHPVMQKAAILDIISQDLQHGPIAAAAEIIAVANDVLNSFPNLSQSYDIHVSHNRIIELALNRVSETHRATVVDILNQTKSSPSQKRALLLKQGLLRSSADELEILCESDEDIDRMLSRLEKASPTLVTMMQSAVNEIRTCIQFAVSTGVTRTIHFHPLMLGPHLSIFKDGVIMEVVKKSDTKKKADILAYGGRYDNYISRFTPKQKPDGICAVGIQISIEKITAALAAYQSTSVKTLVKEERSFGFWSPRRCDVYVVSYHPGYLQERLEVASYLWRHNISADIMYESGSVGEDHESHVDICAREGILFTVYPRPRAGRVDHAAFKVKSILKGTEYEVNRQELVSFLQHQIAEQKRIDLTTSGAPTLDTTLNPIPAKEPSVASDVQLLLPIDAKKQRKQVKSLFLDRAFDKSLQIKSSFQSGMPTLAVDVSQSTFEAMVRNSAWVVDDEAWKAILPGFPNSTYALQVREAAAKRKSEGHAFILIYAVKEERVQLLVLN